MIWLSKGDVCFLHDKIIERYGGSRGLKDDGMLESALAAPLQTFGGCDLYPNILQKAARLCYGLVCNHPFIDGNKRIGAESMIVMLKLNKIPFKSTEKELSDTILKIAASELNYENLENWLKIHTAN